MAEVKPVAFMSFVNSDFQHEEGRIAQFRERLIDEVSMHTGKELSIFQDRDDALWREAWKAHVEDSVNGAAFLIAFITPRYFRSEQCRSELTAFAELESTLGRGDLVLPLYYVRCPFLDEEARYNDDELVEVIVSHQHRFDWRELRFQPLTAPEVGKALEELALRIRDALEPVQPSMLSRLSASRMAELGKRGLRGQFRSGKDQPATEAAKPVPSNGLETSAEEAPKPPGPPTRVVDPMGRADHVTISEAISKANSGDRILVRPGLYQEALVIDKPLEIIGDGGSLPPAGSGSGASWCPFFFSSPDMNGFLSGTNTSSSGSAPFSGLSR